MAAKTTPLYIVCSPCRSVGKTLLARLVTEFYTMDDRPAAAFDLADEGPQLADFLPQLTTVAEIGDIFDQMTLFERLLADDHGTTVIDLSHRTFEHFFKVVHEIDFFEEARCRAIEPLILFVIDSDPRSPKAYTELRERFTEASLLPVCNRVATTLLTGEASLTDGDALPPAIEIPQLPFSLRALIDRQPFSFAEFWQASVTDLPAALDEDLRDWIEGIFLQFRMLELSLGCEGPSTRLASRSPRRLVRRQPRELSPAASNVPAEVRKFAPKRLRNNDGVPMDLLAGGIVDLLHKAGGDLHAAEERISALEGELEHYRRRAFRAEAWLQLLQQEVEQMLLERGVTTRTQLDELSA
jgi:hypothetical protein